MPRPRIPIGKRLFLLALQAGGSTTRARICRANGRNITRAQIAKGLEQCGDLLEVTAGHYKDSRRPSERFTVTMKGWYAAQTLRPGWQPQRLPTSVLQSWLADLLQEHDPWALSIARAFAAEAELKRLKVAGWRLPKKRPKRPEPVLPVVLPPDYSGSGGFRPSTPAAPAVQIRPTTGPTRASDASYYRPMPHTDIRPTAQSTPSNSALADKIKAKGYTVRNGKVLYGGDRWITPEEWMQKEGWRLGS